MEKNNNMTTTFPPMDINTLLSNISERLTKIETMMASDKEHSQINSHESRLKKLEIDLAVLKDKMTLYGAGAGFLVSLVFSIVVKLIG